jgi:regulator of extracellular matrix RemA (YlzA/DUF370 family)
MMISIGQKHFIESDYIVDILRAVNFRRDRAAHTAAGSAMMIDATGGQSVRSIIRLKSSHIVLSSLGADTLKSRLGKEIHCPESGKRALLRRRPKKKHPRETKPCDFNDRRIEPDRRHFSYTLVVPDRRSGTERRNKNGNFDCERKN